MTPQEEQALSAQVADIVKKLVRIETRIMKLADALHVVVKKVEGEKQ